MKSHLQFLTTPTADSPGTSLLLHFDNKRYLIGNVAEGTQRAAIQQGARLLKIQDLFLTGRTEWQNNGGLLGCIMGLADSSNASTASSAEDLRKKMLAKMKKDQVTEIDEAQVKQEAAKVAAEKSRLTIYGAENLNYMLATARSFVFRKGLPVDAHEISARARQASQTSKDSEPLFTDDNIKVWAMAVDPSSPSAGQRADIKAGSVSPRKRSFDEAMRLDGVGKDQTATSDKARLDIAKNVVHEMFDSSWRKDALIEVPLSEVKLPAKIFRRNQFTRHLEPYDGPMPGGSRDVSDIMVLVRQPWPGAFTTNLPPTTPCKTSLSYIFRNHPRRGKFDPKKAKELGLTEARKYSDLVRGNSLINDKGETITPEMVMGETRPGGGVAVIDLPSVEYVESLIAQPEWQSEEIMAGVGVFVWILGPGVADDTRLRDFIRQKSHAKHVVSSPELCANRLTFDSVTASTIRLSQIDPLRYVTPYYDNITKSNLDWCASNEPSVAVHLADRGIDIELEPSTEIRTDGIPPLLDREQVISGISPEVTRLAAEAREILAKEKDAIESWATTLPERDAEVITLGTGSALPSKYRNVSATLVRVPGWGSMLLDAGENTLGQLKRVFPPDEFKQVMSELRMIWISHMHADHHLGLVSVIRAWYQSVHGSNPSSESLDTSTSFSPSQMFANQQRRLAVVSAKTILGWLYEYSHVEDFGYSRLAPLQTSCAQLSAKEPTRMTWFQPDISPDTDPLAAFETFQAHDRRLYVSPYHLGLSDLQSVSVSHCNGARAVSITLPSHFKVSYSGDCRPSQAFSAIGQNSTVCIHEATFDDELRGDAIAKKHSTTSEALGVAAQMKAKACVLTHFSQRYQKVPVLEYTEEEDDTAEDDIIVDTEGNGDDAEGEPIVEEGNDPLPTEKEDDEPSAEPGKPNDGAFAATVNKATVKLRKGTDMKVCVAFDYMRVKVGDIAKMERYTPALLALFAEEESSKGKESDKENGGEKGNGNGKVKRQASKSELKGRGKRNN